MSKEERFLERMSTMRINKRHVPKRISSLDQVWQLFYAKHRSRFRYFICTKEAATEIDCCILEILPVICLLQGDISIIILRDLFFRAESKRDQPYRSRHPKAVCLHTYSSNSSCISISWKSFAMTCCQYTHSTVPYLPFTSPLLFSDETTASQSGNTSLMNKLQVV